MDFRKLLKEKDFIIFDGGMGTMLQGKKIEIPPVPEELNITRPDIVTAIHKAYADAGADIIYANTFGINRRKIKGCKYTVQELTEAAVKNVREAVKGSSALVALDLSPVGELLEPTGTLSFEEAYDIFAEVIDAAGGCDLIVLETMTDLYEVRAAVLAAREHSDLPIVCTMTFEENLRTFTGCSVSAMALTLDALGVDAVGVNCSLGPEELYPVVKEIGRWTDLPVVFKPNAGLPDPMTNLFDLGAQPFAVQTARAAEFGVRCFGGCCGTTPEHIRRLKEELSGKKILRPENEHKTAVCSATNTVVIDRPRVIGERINPTGKKRFKEALKANDMNYILGQALEQIEAGADILDVNVGLPQIDEKEMMVRTVKAIQGISDIPLQLDSTDPEVLDAALRIYNGKPIVNSVNGEEKSLQTILPVVKKYGACVICLTLDENGIPKKAEERVAIAEKIMSRALALGIKKENLIVDCLTLTASAEQAAVMETLKAVSIVKNKLGLKTCLGVSNISFGLPNRNLITTNFLSMALYAGLYLPIINPNIAAMMDTVRAYNLLANIDENAAEYVRVYTAPEGEAAAAAKKQDAPSEMDISQAINNGLKEEGIRATEKMLETTPPMEIVNEHIIPALDAVGEKFEKGKVFLPQLILSAGVVQAAFEVLKNHMAASGTAPISKGKVVLATVKGDVHDIGKNIVKVLLENYGYDVIDLGKDVPYEAVVEAVKKDKVKLCGLSALMTTTLKSMEETIKLLNEQCPWCKTVVGGAVLTPEYAEEIKADFYAKDAKETVDVAKKIVGD